jgi:hypothetical protein
MRGGRPSIRHTQKFPLSLLSISKNRYTRITGCRIRCQRPQKSGPNSRNPATFIEVLSFSQRVLSVFILFPDPATHNAHEDPDALFPL